MHDDAPRQPRPRGAGRQFAKGSSGNPGGRPPGARNKATLAAEALLDGEAEGLARRAVEVVLGGDPLALRLCLYRVMPRRRERAVAFCLPPIVAVNQIGDNGGPSPRELSLALNAVTAAMAAGEITPGEATVADVVDRFVHAIARSKRDGLRHGLQLLAQADADDHGGGDAADEEDRDHSQDFEDCG
jgi:Family of unknown function (DUF5681)